MTLKEFVNKVYKSLESNETTCCSCGSDKLNIKAVFTRTPTKPHPASDLRMVAVSCDKCDCIMFFTVDFVDKG